MVTKNPIDKNASNLIVFTEPTVKEFTFKNDTNLQLEYQRCELVTNDQSKNGKIIELSESQVIDAKTSEPFVWDSRDVKNKHILIKLTFCDQGHPLIQLN